MVRDGEETLDRPPGIPPDGGSRSSAVSDPVSFPYTTDLAGVRAVVQEYASGAGLAESRVIDLVLAVSEVAANTIRHAKSPGALTMWHDASEVVCQIHDEGVITDPLAGRRRPSLEASGGHGLWIVSQVCDKVEISSGEAGTTIRLHMRLARS
jgi:anti-sigma regulatory factor (Ser/Thr protein kinase)